MSFCHDRILAEAWIARQDLGLPLKRRVIAGVASPAESKATPASRGQVAGGVLRLPASWEWLDGPDARHRIRALTADEA